MSGTLWTPERRAAFSRAMRKRWRSGGYAGRKAVVISEAERQARSTRMRALNVRMRDDERLKDKCIRGQKRVRQSESYRAIQSAVMTDIMSRPELRRAARFHCIKINKNRMTRKRQWAGRRRRAAVAPAGVPA